MRTNPFKPGDRVVYARPKHGTDGLSKGETYTVKALTNGYGGQPQIVVEGYDTPRNEDRFDLAGLEADVAATLKAKAREHEKAAKALRKAARLVKEATK